ncbi:MAG: RNA polymerase sigma factor [Candidatus Aminicenantales bacterium]
MEDKKLVQLSQRGNEEAFSQLVKKYQKKVFNLALALTQNKDIADDLAQEAFIKAYFGLPKFKFKSEFSTWLYRIALNVIKDYIRKKERLDRIPQELIQASPFLKEDEITIREKEKADEMKRRIIHHFIDQLPEKHQIILSLRDIHGFSYQDISKILKISPGTVDSRLFRARKKLRQKIEPYLRQKGGKYGL